jgi:hypothetical protein
MSLFTPGFAEELTAQWNVGPRAFRNALSRPLFDGADFMTALRGAASDYIAEPTARVPPGRLYMNGDMVGPQQLAPLLPRSAAETCDDYVQRIVQTHPQASIGIVLDNCEKHVTTMREELLPPLHHLFTHVGYPARRNHLCIYAGNYRSTPFGIHRDDCHVVMFCGVGKKAMAFWPRPYFDSKPSLLKDGGTKVKSHVREHIADATVLEIGPLDVLYWSADDWHVAVSESDDFQAALSVGIYHHGSSPEVITQLEVLDAITHGEGLDIPGLPGARDGRLAAADLRRGNMSGFFERFDRLREMATRPEEAEYRALRLALRLLSSAGYGPVRKPAPAAPAPVADQVLSCAVPESVVVATVRGGLLIGANGRDFFYEQAPSAIGDAVVGLRRTPRRVEEVIGSVDPASAGMMTAVIGDLVKAGALSAQPAPEPAQVRAS